MIKYFTKNLFLIFLIFSGLLYLFLDSVSITNAQLKQENKTFEKISLPYEGLSNTNNETFIFSVDINSKIAQNKKIHVTVDDEILSVRLNDKEISFSDIKKRYKQLVLKDYRHGYDFILPLKYGKNKLVIKTKNYAKGGYTFKIAQNYFYIDFLIFFLLLVVPVIVVLVNFLDKNMHYLYKSFRYISKLNFTKIKNYYIYLPFFIIVLGIGLRLFYFGIYGHSSYQHDQGYHIEFIKYFAENWALPLPDKAIEFPQQPLYYFLTGKIFAILSFLSISQDSILMFIASLSTSMMSFTLIIAYGILKNITQDRFIINTALAFLAFTPSFVFLSAQINNDPLNYFLASLALYYIIKYYNIEKFRYFVYALIFSVLVFITKVSSGMISIVLFIVLLQKYFYKYNVKENTKEILLHVKIFSIVILMFLGFSFLRVYLPSTHEFLFVNSGVFPGQEIKHLDFSYFFSFRIFDLINEGQSYVYDRVFMPVKQSFFTWQYATMLLGEYNYEKVMQSLNLNRMVYLFSLIYVVGFFSFLYYIKKMPLIVKILFPILIINQLLIANFAFSFPSVCNTDFRYNSPTIIIWAIVIASGLYQLYMNVESLRKFIIYAVVLANIAQIVWLINLLVIAKQNSIT